MLQKICGFFSTILMVVLLALAAVLIVPVILGYTEVAVLTGSMQPTIPVGSLIYVKEVEPSTLQVGDVVTYQLEGDTMVTHRVVEVNPDEGYLVAQGDANEDPDGQITFDRIVGKMDFHLPYLGYISMNIRTKTGIFAICGTLIAIILLTFIPEIFSNDEEEEEKTEPAKKQNQPGRHTGIELGTEIVFRHSSRFSRCHCQSGTGYRTVPAPALYSFARPVRQTAVSQPLPCTPENGR